MQLSRKIDFKTQAPLSSTACGAKVWFPPLLAGEEIFFYLAVKYQNAVIPAQAGIHLCNCSETNGGRTGSSE
jgi:hypothetical protein